MTQTENRHAADKTNATLTAGFLPFRCEGQTIGWLQPTFTAHLQAWPDVFHIDDDAVSLSPQLQTSQTRSAALAPCLQHLRAQGHIHGWRDETYAIRSEDDARVLFHLERAAMHVFGLLAHGVNVNGFVKTDTGIQLWIATRSMYKPIDPGCLDTMVGGGIASGLSPWQTLIKECGEEAGLAPELAQQARACSRIPSHHRVPAGLHREILYCYDLQLSPDVIPHNQDGEVAAFQLMTPATVKAHYPQFSLEARLVTQDFMHRHGLEQV